LANTTTMHDLGIGLFINRSEFGVAIAHVLNTVDTPSPTGPAPRSLD
jgi:hypothetical protein